MLARLHARARASSAHILARAHLRAHPRTSRLPSRASPCARGVHAVPCAHEPVPRSPSSARGMPRSPPGARPPGPAALLPAPPSRGRIRRGRTGRHSEDRTTARKDEDLRTRTAKAEDRTRRRRPRRTKRRWERRWRTRWRRLWRRPWRWWRPRCLSLRCKAQVRALALASTIGPTRSRLASADIAQASGRARIHLSFAATRSRWSCWSLEEAAASASAQLVDDVDVAMPAGGDAGGGQARSAERGGPPKPRAAGGSRQGQAAPQGQGAHLAKIVQGVRECSN